MIKEMKPLSMTEVKEIVESVEEKKEMSGFFKKFVKLNAKKAEELKEELESLDMLKLKPEHTVKIIDLLPEDVSDINKAFVDVGLDENEINKLLEVVKKYR